jgi:hypothetical protein
VKAFNIKLRSAPVAGLARERPTGRVITDGVANVDCLGC